MPRQRLLLDTTPLRDSREYRLLYAGQIVSILGRQLTVVAIPYQVFVLTRSSLLVGLVSLVQFVPLLATSLVGGAVADAFDRRRILLLSNVLMALTSIGLALNAAAAAPAVWPLFVLSAANAGFSAVDSPTRAAAIPGLVSREQLPAAYALNQIGFQLGHALGPAIAGVVIAQFSLAAAYWIDAATFGVAFLAVTAMAAMPPSGGGRPVSIASVAEGFRYLRGRRVIQSTFYIDINAMVFGMPRALFPELGTTVLGGGAGTVGLLYAAPGAGAFLATLSSGWVSTIHRQGRAVLVAVVFWGLAITGFGLTSWLPLALVLLAVAGGADAISAVFRNTILQLRVPDRLRGRLSAVHIAVVAGGPRLGDAEAGAVATLVSPRFAVVSGGLACLAGVGILHLLVPQLDRVTATDQEIEEAAADVLPIAEP